MAEAHSQYWGSWQNSVEVGGSGKQGMSWIHETDLNALFDRALIDGTMCGTYIASSSCPVSQKEFMWHLRRAVRMPLGFPAFGWMVRLDGSSGVHCILRTDSELALYGRYVVSKRLSDEGFEFEWPHLADALKNLLRSDK